MGSYGEAFVGFKMASHVATNYWSSSEYSSNNGWNVNLNNGNVDNNNKNNNYRVRLVRDLSKLMKFFPWTIFNTCLNKTRIGGIVCQCLICMSRGS